MPTELFPLRERLLVRKDAGAERIGRLIVPDSVRKPQTVATVISTGPGYFQGYDASGQPIFAPIEFRPGDRVVIGEFAGVELQIDGATAWLLVPEDVFCKLGESAEVEVSDARA